jgi:hypothetical protein
MKFPELPDWRDPYFLKGVAFGLLIALWPFVAAWLMR